MRYALVENGRVTQFPLRLPVSYQGVVNFQSLPDAELKVYGWYPVNETKPDHDVRIQTRSGPVFTVNADDVDAVWTVTDKPLADVKSDFVTKVKEDARAQLAETDWMRTREADGGTTMPSETLTARSAIRSDSNTTENNINAVTTAADAAAAYDTWVSG